MVNFTCTGHVGAGSGRRLTSSSKVTGVDRMKIISSLFLLALLTSGCRAQNQTNEIPYVAGTWEITYTYNEMFGPLGGVITNPCRGPFPYRYTWNVLIYQLVSDVNGTKQTTGNIRACWSDRMNCINDALNWTIREGDSSYVKQECYFRPYDQYGSNYILYPGYPQGLLLCRMCVLQRFITVARQGDIKLRSNQQIGLETPSLRGFTAGLLYPILLRLCTAHSAISLHGTMEPRLSKTPLSTRAHGDMTMRLGSF